MTGTIVYYDLCYDVCYKVSFFFVSTHTALSQSLGMHFSSTLARDHSFSHSVVLLRVRANLPLLSDVTCFLLLACLCALSLLLVIGWSSACCRARAMSHSSHASRLSFQASLEQTTKQHEEAMTKKEVSKQTWFDLLLACCFMHVVLYTHPKVVSLCVTGPLLF